MCSSRRFFFVNYVLFLRERVFAKSANRAGKVLGDIFPFRAGSDSVFLVAEVFVIDITAYANVFHSCFSLLFVDCFSIVVVSYLK